MRRQHDLCDALAALHTGSDIAVQTGRRTCHSVACNQLYTVRGSSRNI